MTKVDEYRARVAAAWEPTPELRWRDAHGFQEATVFSPPHGDGGRYMLQQLWHNAVTDADEWRDVPVVREEEA